MVIEKNSITSHEAFIEIIENNSYPSEKAKTLANTIYEFFCNIDTEHKIMNDFYISIRNAVVSKYISDSALIGYAPLAYDKLINLLNDYNSMMIRKTNSKYVGNIGDKITAKVKVMNCISFESKYGISYINIFEDTNTGNEYVWITSTVAFNQGYELEIKGTIKQHKEYNGTKQTVLTRVKEIS